MPEDLVFVPRMGLEAALARFAFSLSLLQRPAAVRRVADEMCEDAAAEGVTTLEIRFAPQLHRGASPEAIVEAALEGIDGRAGLVLCGLYGEDPAVLARLVAIGAQRPGVVGLDLAGGPAPGHRWSLGDYAPAFRAAAEVGMGTTAHAGEGRPPAEIRDAVELLGVQRVGHGTTALEDPAVRDLLVARGVTIEACLTSNWHVGAIASVAEHPIARQVAAGLAVCVCADNTLFSQTDATREHGLAAAMLDRSAYDRVVAAGHAAAFRRT